MAKRYHNSKSAPLGSLDSTGLPNKVIMTDWDSKAVGGFDHYYDDSLASIDEQMRKDRSDVIVKPRKV